ESGERGISAGREERKEKREAALMVTDLRGAGGCDGLQLFVGVSEVLVWIFRWTVMCVGEGEEGGAAGRERGRRRLLVVVNTIIVGSEGGEVCSGVGEEGGGGAREIGEGFSGGEERRAACCFSGVGDGRRRGRE
ncbi:hypothetical protein HAX54_002169, partial [Datura stramonium]|nr:hypothetical protein [Datura stramonium]